ncbi:CHAT domain-containing protein [Argonema galeatum]|uniref:CHAT domain-containing protein n=1 Tax=Argonema galeatum TaxID=2942762 RepID=UPI002011648E|nr:CHAT domain-containing tetratricopeptide repeat protein [Argonema galeatum]MCL1466472.1 CHAT domain-containing protein [Argonema galeatum A003/A1]
MDENRIQDYLQLINALLTCSSGQENSLLQNNRELLDETLVQIMRLVADQKQQAGQQNTAIFLLDWAEYLEKSFRETYWELVEMLLPYSSINQVQGILDANPNLLSAGLIKTLEQAAEALSDRGERNKANFLIDIASQIAKNLGLPEPSPPSFKVDIFFFYELFSLVAESNADQEIIHRFLKTKLHLLHEVFPSVLEEWASERFLELKRDEAKDVAIDIHKFSLLISRFPLGNRATNLEIAITGYKAVDNVFTIEAYPKSYAINQISLGDVYVARKEGKCLEDLKLAIECFSNALNVFTYEADPKAWASLQYRLGMVYVYPVWGDKQAESLEKAIDYFKAALEVQNCEDTPTDWAETKSMLGLAYADYADYVGQTRSDYLEKAIQCYLDALNVHTQNDYPEDWAWIKKHLGGVYIDRIDGERAENIEAAINCYLDALKVRTKEANPDKWAKTQINLGTAYRDRIRDSRVENLQKSISCFLDALDVYTQENSPEDWSIIQHNLGNTCLAFAQYEPSILEFIVTQEERTKKLEQAIKGFLAASQEYIRLGYYKSQRWAMLQNSLGNAYVYRSKNIENIETNLKDLEAAISYFLDALDVFKTSTFPNNWANIQNSLGGAYAQRSHISQTTKNEDIKAAISHFLNALTIHTRDDFPQYYAETQKNLANVYYGAERYQDAYNAYKEAIDTAESLRTKIISGSQSEEDKKKLAEEWKSAYQSMVATCLKLEHSNQDIKYRNEAIEYVERSKARNITELIHQHSSSIEQLSPISFDRIKALLDEKKSIVEWYFAGGEILVFIITNKCKTPIICKLPFDISLAELTTDWSSVNFFRTIDDKLKWRSDLVSRLQTLAQELHIDEILSQIPPSIDKLILIPNLFLHLFPLHALPISQETWRRFNPETESPEPTNPCLLDCFKQGVSYAPSCQLLQQAKKRERTNFNNFIAIQDPTGDLPYTNIEVEAISHYFTSKNILARQEATKTALYNYQLDTAHCVHFSCHGYFNFWKPLNSAIILADSQISPPIPEEDSSRYLRLSESEILDLRKCLTLDDVSTLDLRECRLVVLSACETAVSDNTSISDEYISLTSGFLVAGSSSVVATLWAVDDISTALLMIKFYQNLQQRLSVGLALNSAQIWLRDVTGDKLKEWTNDLQLDENLNKQIQQRLGWIDPDEKQFQNPVFWAAFCAIGRNIYDF